jgi:hypothetical protein
MSIVVCVRVYDGIVIGSESMTQLYGQVAGQAQPQFLKSYSHARKLFQIGNLPIGILTYGAGNVGSRSIESFVDQFSEGLPEEGDPRTVQELATAFRDFFRLTYDNQFGQLQASQRPAIGFYVAGYSQNEAERIGADWEFMFPQADVVRPRTADFGASWRGVGLPFTRLYFGVDPRLYEIMRAQGIQQQIIERVQQQASITLGSPVAFDGMPVKDAIGYCEFILRTTVGVCTYELGVPTCGGPLQVAVITKKEFQWIMKPKLSAETHIEVDYARED